MCGEAGYECYALVSSAKTDKNNEDLKLSLKKIKLADMVSPPGVVHSHVEPDDDP